MVIPSKESPSSRENRLRELFNHLDVKGDHRLDADDLSHLLIERYQPFDNMDEIVDELIVTITQSHDGTIDYECFKQYMIDTEGILERTFDTLDRNKDGKLDFDEIRDGFKELDLHVDDDKVELFFHTLDSDDDGFISMEDWRYNLLFIPNRTGSPLQAAYIFFIEDMDLSSEGDVILSSETLNGVGYFLAGGLAGVVSRTCTAPFDRLKVYLIAQSGQPKQPTTSSSVKTGGSNTSARPNSGNASNSLKSNAAKVAQEATAAKQVSKFEDNSIVQAVRHLWSKGGVRSFFVGNGLNVVKVFPESAMKFGSFEVAKRFFCTLEDVSDTTELSRAATFLSGGIGGMVSQFTIYPIDTLKFRVQCEAQYSTKRGNKLLVETATKMWRDGGMRTFYRGLWVGVCGIFPFAALDLGTFSAMKKAYILSQATKLDMDPSDIEMGNMAVLTMGALSGSVGASVVYPINLLRTRLQAQGTTAHPYTYNGFRDVFQKTIKRDGVNGLWRGLGPNLAKVAPAVSISYLVYENAKSTMKLQ